MNEKNLIPNSERSPSELKAMTTKGGIASGKARKEKAELKKLFIQFANMKPTEEESSQLKAMGFKDNEVTNMTSYVVSLFKNGAKGNSKAMEIGVDLLMNYNKKELENQKLREEIKKLQLEQEKLQKEIDNKNDGTDEVIELFGEYMERLKNGK